MSSRTEIEITVMEEKRNKTEHYGGKKEMVLKVGVVGIPYPRGIGMTHANCYVQDPLAELVAVCGIVKERADNAVKKFGVKAYYSVEDMLEKEPDLDIVDVCTGGYENGSLYITRLLLWL